MTPSSESIELFKRARQPVELHMISGGDHFMFSEKNKRVMDILSNWLQDFFPSTI